MENITIVFHSIMHYNPCDCLFLCYTTLASQASDWAGALWDGLYGLWLANLC